MGWGCIQKHVSVWSLWKKKIFFPEKLPLMKEGREYDKRMAVPKQKFISVESSSSPTPLTDATAGTLLWWLVWKLS